MATPVYELLISRATEAYYDLCDRAEDHQGWLKELREAMEQAGGESVVFCYSLDLKVWAFMVMKFPDMDACVKAQIIRKGKRAARYFDTTSYVGFVRDDWVEMAKALGVYHTNRPDGD